MFGPPTAPPERGGAVEGARRPSCAGASRAPMRAHRACCSASWGNPIPRWAAAAHRCGSSALGAQRPHPECGSRILRDNSLILVITGVEAGERAPSRRSAGEWPCWPVVGGQRLPVVDTWTDRRLCTVTVAGPRPVPCPPPARPQSVPSRSRASSRDRPASSPSLGVPAGQGVVRQGTGRADAEGDEVAVPGPAGRSPQPVHIPGDNFSIRRPRSVTAPRRSARNAGIPSSPGFRTGVDNHLSTAPGR